MKRLFMVLVILALAVSVVACASNTSDTTTPAETTAAPDDTTGAPSELPKNEGTLAFGTYNGSSSYSDAEAGFSMTWIINLTLNADGTFKLSDASSEKGSGTYVLENDAYTLNFSNGKTSSFVVLADGTLLVTSNLPYGTASISLDSVDDIILTKGADPEETTTSGDTDPVTPGDETYSFKAGTYTGTYEKVSPMAGTVEYVYTAIIGEDGTFSYSVKFEMAGTPYDGASGVGTYTVSGNVFTFTPSDGGEAIVGALTADNTVEIALKASAMASEPYTVTLTPAVYTVAAGTYTGTYEKVSPMAGTVEYVYTAIIGEDSTFSYSVKFEMAGTPYDGASANGTYTVSGNVFTFTPSDGGDAIVGALTAINTVEIALKASAMASEPYTVTLTPAN